MNLHALEKRTTTKENGCKQQVEPPPPTQAVDFELTPPPEPPPSAPKSKAKAFYGIIGSFGQVIQSVEPYENSSNAERFCSFSSKLYHCI